VFWVYQAADTIREIQLPAYLVDRGSGQYYIVISLTGTFVDQFGAALRRLTKDGEVVLSFHDGLEGRKDETRRWYVSNSSGEFVVTSLTDAIRDCMIVEHPATVSALVNHLGEDQDLILSGHLDDHNQTFRAKTFPTRSMANEHLNSGDSH
jgi:hypothetical protein